MEEFIKNQLYSPDKSELCEIIDNINNIEDVENKEHKAIIILNLLKNYVVNFLLHLDCRSENETKISFGKEPSLLSNLCMCEFCCSGLGAEISRSFSENLVFESQKKIKCSDFKNRESPFINKILQTTWKLSPSQQIGELVFEIARIIFSNDLLNASAKKKFLLESEVLLKQISSKYCDYSFSEIIFQ